MNFHKLSLTIDKTTRGVKSYHIRQSLLAIFDDMECDLKSKLNFHISENEYNLSSVRKIPYVLFGFPYKNYFTLYSYNDDVDLLQYISKHLPKNFYANKEYFTIVSTKIESLEIVPLKKSMTYKTLSPILLFTGNRRKWLDAVLAKEPIENRDNIIKTKIEKLLIENIRYQTQQLLKNKPYQQFDEIKLLWSEFKFIRLKVREKNEYGIVGRFTSNYRLPKFVGHKIGFGYGEIASC